MRYQNWPSLLNTLISQRTAAPFVWGRHDCCLFAADCVKAITGIDYAADIRDTYDSAFGAARIIADRGGMETMITNLLGTPQPVLMSRRGDIVMIDQSEYPSLAVCVGTKLVAAGNSCLVSVPLSSGLLSWRVS